MKSALWKFLSKARTHKPVQLQAPPKFTPPQTGSSAADVAKQAYDKVIDLVVPFGNSMNVWQGQNGTNELHRVKDDSFQLQQESTRGIHAGSPTKSPDATGDTSVPGHISFAVVPKEKSEIVSSFLIQHYHEQEPITVALGMPVSEVDGWFQRYIRHVMFVSACDVSVQAIDEKAKLRVGVLSAVLVNPTTTQRPLVNSWTNKKVHPINAQMNDFYDKLEAGLDPTKALNIDTSHPIKYIEHLYLSVHPAYAKQGISNEMVRLSESVAANVLNCRIGYTITSSEYSYLAFLKNGYQVIRELKYSDYADSSGNKIFAGMEEKMKPHTTCRVMAKQFDCLHQTP